LPDLQILILQACTKIDHNKAYKSPQKFDRAWGVFLYGNLLSASADAAVFVTLSQTDSASLWLVQKFASLTVKTNNFKSVVNQGDTVNGFWTSLKIGCKPF
jgi:hypothetical protein